MERRIREWIADVVLGGFVGGITGAIVGVNFVIYSGIEPGYQASISDVFRQSTLAGVVTIVILAGAPVTGVILAHFLRRKRKDRRE